MPRAFSELAFTPSVRQIQSEMGSAQTYEKFLSPEVTGGNQFGPDEVEFISRMDSFYQATVSETGWPYVQYRGGPPGFLKVLDDATLAYADFRGNRQYISVGNLTQNNRIALILMDYANKARMKVLGEVSLVSAENDPDLIASLHHPDYKARPERAFVISLKGFDWNCPQHIHQRFTIEQVNAAMAPTREKLEEMRAENAALREELSRLKND